jgi:hypothetical protein
MHYCNGCDGPARVEVDPLTKEEFLVCDAYEPCDDTLVDLVEWDEVLDDYAPGWKQRHLDHWRKKFSVWVKAATGKRLLYNRWSKQEQKLLWAVK